MEQFDARALLRTGLAVGWAADEVLSTALFRRPPSEPRLQLLLHSALQCPFMNDSKYSFGVLHCAYLPALRV